MYDTVKMRLITDETCHIPDIMENGRMIYDKQDDWYLSYGKIRNLKINVKENSVKIDGSLAKFKFGNNYQTLSIFETKDVIEELSEILKLRIDQAKISRIDFGTNFILECPVGEYLSCLGDLSRFEKTTSNNFNTLYYKNSIWTLAFYNKMKEMKKHKIAVPPYLHNRNYLRYELKLLRDISDKLKLGEEIRAYHLYDGRVFEKLVREWAKKYFAIERYKKIKLDFDRIPGKVPDFRNQIFAEGIRSFGQDTLKHNLKMAVKAGKMEKSQYYRCNRAMKQILQNKSCVVENDCILELDEKVKGVVDMVCSKN